MINNEITTKGMESAQKALEQAKNRVAVERRKVNAERRKFEDHYKYMMDGAVHKYFPECYSFEESEINEILKAAFKTSEVQKTISNIKARANGQVLSRPVESEVNNDEPNRTESH